MVTLIFNNSSETPMYGKPDMRVYRHALASFNLAPGECMDGRRQFGMGCRGATKAGHF